MRAALHARARALKTIAFPAGYPAFTFGPYLPSEIFEGDLVDGGTGPTAYGQGSANGTPTPTLGSVSVLLNGISQGQTYQTVVGDAGKVMQLTQDATNTLGTRHGTSKTVMIVPPLMYGNGLTYAPGLCGVNMSSVQYSNAVLSARGFGVQGTFAATQVANGVLTFSQATAGSGVVATSTLPGNKAGSVNGFYGTSDDVGKYITIAGQTVAQITAAISTTQAMVTLLVDLAQAGPYPSWLLGTSLDTDGWPLVPAELVLSAGTAGVVDGQLTHGQQYWISYKSAGQAVTMVASASNVTMSGPFLDADGVTTRYSFTITTLGGVACFQWNGRIWDVDCPFDGSQSSAGQPLYRSTCLAHYARFYGLRMMDFLVTNGSNNVLKPDQGWGSRPFNYAKCQAGMYPSWESVTAFVQALKAYPGSKLRKVWLNFGAQCTADYGTGVATLLNTLGWPSSVAIRWEVGNEIWNSSFSTNYHLLEQLANADAKGIANYELAAVGGYSAFQIASVVADGAGTATVTMKVSNAAYPFIQNGAQCIVCCSQSASANFSSPILAATGSPSTTLPVTITLLDDGSTSGACKFTYHYQGTLAANATAGSGLAIYFNLASQMLTDGYFLTVERLKQKYYIRAAYRLWQTVNAVRPQDKFVIGLSAATFGTPNNQNGTVPIEFSYPKYISGGSMAWVEAMTIAGYVSAGASATTVDLLFTQGQAGSFYVNSTNSGLQGNDNQIRGFIGMCRRFGVKPVYYEGGPDTQQVPSLVVAAHSDERMGAVVTAIFTNWCKYGGDDFFFYSGTPKAWTNAAQGGWSICQTYTDSITPGDPNYSPKLRAFLAMMNTPRNYGTIDSASGFLGVSHYLNGTELAAAAGGNGNTNGSAPNYYWFARTYARNVDFLFCSPRMRRYAFTIYGSDATGFTTIATLQYDDGAGNWITLGTTQLVNNGSGALAGTVCVAAPTIYSGSVEFLGPVRLRVLFPANMGGNPCVSGIAFAPY